MAREAMRRGTQLLVLGGILLSGQPAWAARLLNAHVHRDGKEILETMFTDGGREDAATVWSYFEGAVLEPVGAPPGNDQQITLNGDIRIDVKHVDRVIAQSQVKELRLIRSPEGNEWQFAPGEVERTAHAAGLRLVRPSRLNASSPLVLGVVIVLAALIVWLVWRSAVTRSLSP